MCQDLRRIAVARCVPVFAALLLMVLLTAAFSSPATAATVTCSVDPAAVVFGNDAVVEGTVDPAVAGQEVAVDLDGVQLKTILTDAAGHFVTTITPDRGAQVTARLVADGSVSMPVTLEVKPRLVGTRVLSRCPFGYSKLAVRVAPAAYRGVIGYKVYHHTRLVARGSVTARAQTTSLRFKTPGVGKFKVTITFNDWNGLSQRALSTSFRVTGKRITVGSSGPQVTALLKRLAYLRFRIPGVSSRLSTNARDSIMAFQKAYRLARTYVFDGNDWAKLDVAKVIAPRSKTPKLHIEIDKTRQILMVVKNGAVYGVICISSGATGNTPEGWHRILWKSPATSSWLGAGVLYRTMTFHGNFAIHGYAPVPPYPASHGCVREPYWVANWTYINSFVGEAVYVYH